jgi:hypothetical protein
MLWTDPTMTRFTVSKPNDSIPTGLELLQEARTTRGIERMADLMEEIDLAEDVNNEHESDDDEIDFDMQ